ncbi:sulfate permease, SulP family [Fontimonas thermophila]|uniref:Sulfate permease, SulP family n=1 Tax=Fontimonas thermophila TaxID=1076937 RepID=A0A1I2JV49_9GAMM|nr:SulP family inorganic anion transporter [Fontimonas thermophila]SFF56997.1 sulfate permease, SulP family [Fontimonas thermophila]
MIAIVEATRAGLLRREHWSRNIVAGIIVGIVALPLAMAFAIASGVRPERGIYTAIVAGLTVSLFGGCRIQIAGPTGAFIVILAAVTARHGVDGLLLATAMAGLILITLGLAGFGSVLRFIPDPVVTGFTAGIAVVIWIGQWRDFFGLPAMVSGEHFHERLWALLKTLPHLDLPTTTLALGSLLIAVYGPRIPHLARIPGPLLAMVVATTAQTVAGLDSVATISSTFGAISSEFPIPSLPAISFDRIVSLLPSAFTIAMLGAIESLLSAVVADNLAGTRHDSNQELIGQGIANVIAPIFGGFAATGAIARTATNFRNGATSPLAGIVHALTLLVILLVLAPLAGRIPLCALAAILFVVAWNMSETRRFLEMVRTAPGADVAILLITFLLTVFADLVIAVNVGVILAMLLFVRRMANAVKVRRQTDTELDSQRAPNVPPITDDVAVFVIEGPLFFGAVDQLEQALDELTHQPRAVIIRLPQVPFLDITGIQALGTEIQALEKRGVRVALTEARSNVLRKLVRAGLIRKSAHPLRYYRTFADGLADLVSVTP